MSNQVVKIDLEKNNSPNSKMSNQVVKIDLEKNNSPNSKMEQPNYPNCLTTDIMKELGLFDNLLYGKIKGYIEYDEDIEVEIEDLKSSREGYKKTSFKFDLHDEIVCVIEYDIEGQVHKKLQELVEEQQEYDDDHYKDDADDMKEVIGEFNICDNLELFKSDFPRKEFEELQEELDMDGYLECFIHEPKEKATGLPNCYSDISISFGSNKRVIRTSYNSSSPFALWLCGIDIHYYAESDSESE
jgi:hypothetical protein